MKIRGGYVKKVAGFIVVLMTLLTGCAGICCSASGPDFKALEPSSDANAVVYVYRPYFNVRSAGSRPVLQVDGAKTDSRLLNGGYVRTVLSPGLHIIEINWQGVTMKEINVEAGKTYFLKYNVGGQFDTLYPVSQEEAVAELKQTRQSK
jgi:hypothetical protein